MSNNSTTSVAFTWNPGSGENKFYGEYLINAQGEVVVAGIRTPAPINTYSKNDLSKNLVTLEKVMPKAYKEWYAFQSRLDKLYEEGTIAQKPQITGSIYPEKLVFDGFQYRTARLNEAVQLIYTLGKGLIEIKNRKSNKNLCLSGEVAGTGIEPVFAPWKGAVLTDRRTGHFV